MKELLAEIRRNSQKRGQGRVVSLWEFLLWYDSVSGLALSRNQVHPLGDGGSNPSLSANNNPSLSRDFLSFIAHRNAPWFGCQSSDLSCCLETLARSMAASPHVLRLAYSNCATCELATDASPLWHTPNASSRFARLKSGYTANDAFDSRVARAKATFS